MLLLVRKVGYWFLEGLASDVAPTNARNVTPIHTHKRHAHTTKSPKSYLKPTEALKILLTLRRAAIMSPPKSVD